MNQPQGPWGQPPQGPPPQQGGYQQPGYGYAPQPGYAPQGTPGSGPYGGAFPGQVVPGAGGGYDFGQLYGQADMSSNLLDKGQYDAVVESASWDRTKDGTKSAWTIVFRTTTGMHPDTKLTMTLSVSPTKNDGSPNNQGLGIMFRQIGALGIPVPPNQPFWELGWSPEQVAQAMTGRPCLLSVIQDEYEGITRNKVRDIRPPRPGAPTQRVQAGQAQQQPFASPPQAGGMPPAGPGPQNPGWQPQQPGTAPQPWQPPQQPGQYAQGGPGQPPNTQQPQSGQAPGYGAGQPPQGQGQWYGPQGQPQGDYQQPPQGYNPAVPGYAQPAQPSQPGTGQFTQQGQAVQPGTNPQQGYQQGPPPNGYQGQQQPGQPGPDGAPAPPPWAQQ